MTNPRRNNMTIRLTPEQERRIRAVLSRGAYESVDEVVEAALTPVEQRTVPGFAGTPEELDTLLAEGLASKQLTEDEFWSSVSKRTDALLAEHKTGPLGPLRNMCDDVGKPWSSKTVGESFGPASR
jgi:Arc/MetJ-type ribon-helix-helix transcriptional regulator